LEDKTTDGGVVVGAFALLSMAPLLIASGLARGPQWNGSPRTFESYRRAVESYEQLERTLKPLGLSPEILTVGFYLLSLFLSLFFIVFGYVRWGRSGQVGKVLLVLSSVLFLPAACCGFLF